MDARVKPGHDGWVRGTSDATNCQPTQLPQHPVQLIQIAISPHESKWNAGSQPLRSIPDIASLIRAMLASPPMHQRIESPWPI